MRLPVFASSGKLAFQFSDHLRSGGFVQRLAVPALKTFNADQPLTFQCPCEDDSRTINDPGGGFEGTKQIGDAVSVNQQCLPAECFPARLVDFELPLEHSRLALAQPI